MPPIRDMNNFDQSFDGRPINEPISNMSSDPKNEVSGEMMNKIQRTLFVIDNIRLQTLNTLNALKDLDRADSIKIKNLDTSMNRLLNASDRIVQASESSGKTEAREFLDALSHTNKLLTDLKDTRIKNMTLEEYIARQETERRVQLLKVGEIGREVHKLSNTLGQPFADFLSNNARLMSQTPLRRTGGDILSSMAGPAAPLIAALRDTVPDLIDEYRSVKDQVKGIKERVFGTKEDKSALQTISKNVNVDNLLHKQSDKGLPFETNVASSIGSQIQVDKENNAIQRQILQKQTEQVHGLGLVQETLSEMNEDQETANKFLKDMKENKEGGLLSKVMGSIPGIGGLLKSGGVISGIVSALGAALASPVFLGAITTAITSYLGFSGAESTRKSMMETETGKWFLNPQADKERYLKQMESRGQKPDASKLKEFDEQIKKFNKEALKNDKNKSTLKPEEGSVTPQKLVPPKSEEKPLDLEKLADNIGKKITSAFRGIAGSSSNMNEPRRTDAAQKFTTDTPLAILNMGGM